jgi:hypothetical protein
MGFIAIYMPDVTLNRLNDELLRTGRTNHAININGQPLYRSLVNFGPDMSNVSGKISFNL